MMASDEASTLVTGGSAQARRIAVMATFPARLSVVATAVGSIACQVDHVFLVINELKAAPSDLVLPENVTLVFPDEDLKDVGKFFVPVRTDDFVFLSDDDIIYPPDYCDVMIAKWNEYNDFNPVIGVHGVIYSDFFDGDPRARIVHVFTQTLRHDTHVNQVGTGTVLCRGAQMPSFEFMRDSARFVDLRFAVHCQRHGYARICIARDGGWMQDMEAGASLFETFTKGWSGSVVAEAQEIAGFRFLPALEVRRP